MTWPEAMDVIEYWMEYPPTHELTKAGFGIEIKKSSPKRVYRPTKEDLLAMMNQINRR